MTTVGNVNYGEHTEVRSVDIGDDNGADALRALAAVLDADDNLCLIGIWNMGDYLQAVVTRPLSAASGVGEQP